MKFLRIVSVIVAGFFVLLVLGGLTAFAVIDQDDVKSFLEEKIRSAVGRPFSIRGNLDLDLLSFAPSITAEDIRLANPDWAEHDSMARLQKVRLQIALIPLVVGNIHLKDALFSDGYLYLHQGKTRNNWADLGPTDQSQVSEEQGFFEITKIENVTATNLTFALQNEETSKKHELILHSFQLNNAFSQDRQVRLNGSLNGMPVTFELEQNQDTSASIDRLISMRATVGGTRIFFTGDISDDFEQIEGRLRLVGTGNTLEKNLRAFGLNVGSLKDFDGYGTLKINGELKKVDLTEIDVSYGKSNIAGMVSVDLSGDVIRLESGLNAPRLVKDDIDSLVSDEGKTSSDPGIATEERLFNKESLMGMIPDGLNADVRLTIDEYSASDWTRIVKGGETHLSLREQTIIIDSFLVHTLGGKVSGAGQVAEQADHLSIDLRLAADSIDSQRIVDGLLNVDQKLPIDADRTLGGKFDSVATLKTTGQSLDQLASRLDGTVQIAAETGYVGSLFVEAMHFDVTETLASWLSDNPKTKINCFLAIFDIESGKVKTDKFIVNTDDSNVLGQGTVDLGNETIDFAIYARAKDFSITGSPVYFQLEGDLRKPSLDIGGQKSLLEEAGEALVGPIMGLFEDLFGSDNDFKPQNCEKFRSEIAQIQRKAANVSH